MFYVSVKDTGPRAAVITWDHNPTEGAIAMSVCNAKAVLRRWVLIQNVFYLYMLILFTLRGSRSPTIALRTTEK